jgi:hypothetical protein
LEHTADVPPQQRHLGALQASELTPADDDAAARRLELLQEQTHDRRLARARGPDEKDELAFLDPERDVAKGDHVRLVDLHDALEDDHRRAERARSDGRVLGQYRRGGFAFVDVGGFLHRFETRGALGGGRRRLLSARESSAIG